MEIKPIKIIKEIKRCSFNVLWIVNRLDVGDNLLPTQEKLRGRIFSWTSDIWLIFNKCTLYIL